MLGHRDGVKDFGSEDCTDAVSGRDLGLVVTVIDGLVHLINVFAFFFGEIARVERLKFVEQVLSALDCNVELLVLPRFLDVHSFVVGISV